MIKHLVVSVYDCDTSWIKFLNPNVKVSLCRKGDSILKENEILVHPNVGRDVHTFFKHIHDNYENLDDITFFCQDFPFDHWENIIETINGDSIVHANNAQIAIDGYYAYHYNTFSTYIEGVILSKYGIKKVKGGYMWDMEKSYHHRNGKCIKCLSSGSPQHMENHIDVDSAWYELFKGNPPPVYEFVPGGHFGITKDHAKKRSKHFYHKIVNLLENNELAPWRIERLEAYIFNTAYEEKSFV
jgi:hypothetical protein